MNHILYILLFVSLAIPANSQQAVTVKLNENSKLTINGSTNVNTFSFHQTGDKMKQREISLTSKLNGSQLEAGKHQVGIEVREFKSADPIAQVAFYKMMKTDKYPSLYIRLINYEPSHSGAKTSKGKATVDITIVGKTVRYEIPVTTGRNSNNWQFTGNKRLTIKDFGITPPEPMFGMVKVSEWIDIHMDLHCAIEGVQLVSN